MSRGPNLPRVTDDNNPSNENWNSQPQNQIVWVDSEDVYKPIPKTIKDFTSERGMENQFSKVYIKQGALETLEDHLASNLRVEQGGILFGNAYQDPTYGIYVEINVAIPAPATVGSGVHLEFTSDSWQDIISYARSQHPQENIVGWYHSHPNLGVFMSGTDMNTQRAFFYHPWCLSIVRDPVRNSTGYFLGEQARSVMPTIIPGIQQQRPPILLSSPQATAHDEPSIETQNPEPNTIDLNPENRQRNQRRVVSLPPLKILLVLLFLMMIFVVISLGNSTLNRTTKFNNDQPITPTTFKTDLISFPIEAFRKLEENPKILKYEIIEHGGSIGDGSEIAFLVISQEGKDAVSNVQLEIEPGFLKKEEVLFTNSSDLVQQVEKSNNRQVLDIGSLSPGEGVLVKLFSFKKIGKKTETTNANFSSKTIYFPSRINYETKKNRNEFQEISFYNLQIK
ncbi:Mov34/MPN/PAD-1 family protein [Planktothrix agardhii]|uniref:Mov34/MPN/PAD-1 family protein n=2 Tax=Planktothrix agardhii TaxID=1160 RepID=UPI0020A7C7BC|nr:Mov34/MPN/PAD-1 family protein [Planktothrix agardhii]MCP9296533.1 Mov34/MPN/PAD-1 family protein [Planktothrix agardhii LY1]CAD5913319.1 Ubiquitin carboxyl-terminal hydrolase RPN11 [Planktothrix agardhii]